MRTGSRSLERRLRLGDQLVVERLVEMVLLPLAIVDRDTGLGRLLVQQARQVDPLRLPVVDRRHHVEPVDPADHLVEAAEAELRHQLAHFLGDEEEIIDDVLGLAGEALAQHRVLRRDADRAGVEMALAHHDAAGGDQRRGRKAELVGAEHRADDDVAAGAQPAIDLHRDAAAQARCAPMSAASRRARSPRASRHGSARSAGWRRCRPRSRRS